MSHENGDVEKDTRALSLSHQQDDAELGEYDGLVRYISKYQDGRRGSLHGGVEGDAEEKPKKRWFWQGAGKAAGEGFETPEEWLKTDMKRGLSTHDVENRRKKAGWNELTTEKVREVDSIISDSGVELSLSAQDMRLSNESARDNSDSICDPSNRVRN